MMKPKIDDVLEYVRGDETDPGMRDLLQSHPDGRELLKQARFIIAAMGGRPKSDFARPPATFGLDDMVAASRAPEVDNLSMPAPAVFDALRGARDSVTYYQEGPSRKRRSKPTIRQRLLRNAGRQTEDLGSLSLSTRTDDVAISYDPSEAVMRRYGDRPDIGLMKLQSMEGIEIPGMRITLSLPESVAAGEPISIRVAISLKRRPARYAEIIFMPKTGPFLHIRADEGGVAEFPVPEEEGTLRIEGPEPALLHIKLEK